MNTKQTIAILGLALLFGVNVFLVLGKPVRTLLLSRMKALAATGTLTIDTSTVTDTGQVPAVKFTDKAKELYYMDPANNIVSNLISVWHLEEGSGNRADAYGTNTLTDNNTVISNSGKVVTAGQFTAANSEYLSVTDNASLSMNSTDFTIAAWVYADSLGQNRFFLTKDDLSGQREYGLYYLASTGKFRFYVGNAAGTVSEVEDTSTTVAAGTWYLVIGWHDDTNNTINIQVNNATAVSTAYTSDVKDGTADFVLGRVGTTAYWNGMIDEATVWKRVLTAGERTFLYNNGNGQAIGASMAVLGSVGIGTTAPATKLHVATNTTTLTGKSALIVDQLESQDILTASASGTPKLVILNNGNVGIGFTAPASALDVNGTINATVFDVVGVDKTANCATAGCTATATCAAGHYVMFGMKAVTVATCNTNPNNCTSHCTVGSASCAATSTGSAASVHIYCGKIN